jgi:dihydrofolate reductase
MILMVPTFILYIATSINGYIARSNGSIDWLTEFETPTEEYGYAEFYGSIDALVMGSKSYEQVLDFGEWPYAGKASYVLTNRNLITPRNDVFFIANGIEELLRTLSEHQHQRVWIVGGGKIASLFVQYGLIDEYLLFIIPVLLDSGIPLFQSVPDRSLELVEVKSYPSGAAKLHYRKKLL